MNLEQKILLNWLNATFDIDYIEHLYYQGNTAGSEFVIYDAQKLYFCLNLRCSTNNGPVYVAQCNMTFYNAANAAFLFLRDSFAFYDTSVPDVRYPRPAGAEISNIYFSRFVVSYYSEVRFIGYRITLV